MYKTHLKDFLNSEFRDIKLYIVTEGEFSPGVNLNRLRKGNNKFFSQKYWPILKEWKGKVTITGSCSLYAFGLLDRVPNDIDFLIDKKNLDSSKLFQNRYPGMEGKMDVLGYYPKNGYNVDFFHSIEHSTVECDGFLFHHPLEVVQKKIDILDLRRGGDTKDFYDICKVFKTINPNYTNKILR
jgi:hypothetical protein